MHRTIESIRRLDLGSIDKAVDRVLHRVLGTIAGLAVLAALELTVFSHQVIQ